ncbi:unnamed protein product [Linum trigynum]|uniref:Uncharacterized protein n=1 Tax=Linum trigynum TaxID=586398 RepID=A0AAV2D600_9ROSI
MSLAFESLGHFPPPPFVHLDQRCRFANPSSHLSSPNLPQTRPPHRTKLPQSASSSSSGGREDRSSELLLQSAKL